MSASQYLYSESWRHVFSHIMGSNFYILCLEHATYPQWIELFFFVCTLTEGWLQSLAQSPQRKSSLASQIRPNICFKLFWNTCYKISLWPQQLTQSPISLCSFGMSLLCQSTCENHRPLELHRIAPIPNNLILYEPQDSSASYTSKYLRSLCCVAAGNIVTIQLFVGIPRRMLTWLFVIYNHQMLRLLFNPLCLSLSFSLDTPALSEPLHSSLAA